MRLPLAALLAFAIVAPCSVAAQGFRTEPLEHLAFLGDPVDRFVSWASTRDAAFASESEAASRTRGMTDALGHRIGLANPIGFDSSLVAAFRAFHGVATGALKAYDAAKGRQAEDPGAPSAALRTGLQAIVSAIPQVQTAVGPFAGRHEASAQGLACRRINALVERVTSASPSGPDSFLGTLLTNQPYSGADLLGILAEVSGPDAYAQSTARLRHIANQIKDCPAPGGATWAVQEQERSYATGKNVLLFATPDGIPFTGEGDPKGAHISLAADSEGLLMWVRKARN